LFSDNTLNHFWIFLANAFSWGMDQMEEYYTATEVLLVSFCLAEEYYPSKNWKYLSLLGWLGINSDNWNLLLGWNQCDSNSIPPLRGLWDFQGTLQEPSETLEILGCSTMGLMVPPLQGQLRDHREENQHHVS
jgi:hypothetical protein